MINIEAVLVNRLTGEEVTHKEEYEGTSIGGTEFSWTEGNFSCDCNRSIVFYDDGDKELPCNVEENIIVLKELRVTFKLEWSHDMCSV